MKILLDKLLDQANKINGLERTSEYTKITSIIILPDGVVKTLGTLHFNETSNFISEKTDVLLITLRMLPVDYVKKVLPFRDNLEIQLIISDYNNRVVRTFTAIPLSDGNPSMEGSRTEYNDLEGISATSFHEYQFQLMDRAFSKLRNVEVSKTVLMGTVGDIIPSIMDGYSSSIELTGVDKYDGVLMESPVHNQLRYKSITIPEGVLLKDLPNYVQEDDRYGVYSKGLSCFFRRNKWWISTPFDTELYNRRPKKAEIIRLPKNKIPTLSNTFKLTENIITILSTGEANHIDGTDIAKQTDGSGKRLIMSDAISGKAGIYYNNGRAITTRMDSLAEYQTSQRKSGNEYIPLVNKPTSNVYKYASYNAMHEGTVLTLEWQNSDPGYIDPCMPVRYTYIGNNGSMITMIGVIIAIETDHIVIDNITLNMKRNSKITMFLRNIKEDEE